MSYASLRDFIEKLEELGELRRVTQEVDYKYEIGAWTYHACNLDPPGPALLFENVRGYDKSYRVLTNVHGTYRRLAIALGLDPDASKVTLINTFRERLKGQVKPYIVETGPVKENIHIGNNVNLLEFPTPWWHPRDGGRYIGTWHGVVSKDPESSRINMGTYRVQIQDKDKCTIGFLPGQHIGFHFSKRQSAGDTLEVAVVIGADETVPIIACTGIPFGVCEYDVIGSMRQEPLPLVRCNTVDLEVPANAEIVIEGRLHTSVEQRLPEGPFSEYLGYHGGSIRMRPILEVTCIMHRNDPILRGSLSGKPKREGAIVNSIQGAAEGLAMFDEQGPAGVKLINNLPEAGGQIVTIIQIKPYYIGHSWQVARTWLSHQIGQHSKLVIIVDDDIDPFNLGEVFWALGSRTQGGRDTEVWKFCKTSRSDPSVPRDRGEYTDRLIIDATKKLDYAYEPLYGGHWAPVAVPPREMLKVVGLKWKKEVNEEISQMEIDKAVRELRDVHYKRWEEFRDKHYALTPEMRERELALSYPRLTKDPFE